MSVNLTLPTITAQELKLPAVDPINLTVGIVFESAPVITGVPTIAGTAKVGQTLTATAASSSGVPTPTDSFQWQRSDNGTTGWADISGATNTTYTAVTADENKYLRVVQTSTNVAGSDSANSASTAQVAPAFTGLLDTYSGAAAAYSLRLLSSTYSGSAIRVRRADDNAEQDIGFRNNELDTSTLETFSLGSDCFVVTWYDQSGGTNNATQTTASAQPKIVSSGSTITENGKPCIDFDASDDRLELNGIFSGATEFTFIEVDKPNNTNVRVNYWAQFIDFSNVNTFFRYNNNGTIQVFLGDNETAIDSFSSSSSYSAQQNLQFITYDSSQSATNQVDVFVNGSNFGMSGSTAFGTLNTVEDAYIGSRITSNYFDGKIQEIVAYTTEKSTDRSGIETNINDYYSIY
jgi:hypothetical protein